MKVVIVGGTSQVATELCMLLLEQGHEVHPIVRSRVGASFYDYHGIEYRIVDVTDQDEATKALHDADVVVIAAFARQYSRGFSPKQARMTNEQIVRCSVRATPPESTIVYFSSIAAFGKEVGFSNLDSYGREKRHAEDVLKNALQTYGKHGYAFRMGPVYGVNQDKATNLRERIKQSRSRVGSISVDVEPDRRSNALHTVTLMDAIEAVDCLSFEHTVYTLVNEPPWSWREMLEHYAPEGTKLKFEPINKSDSMNLMKKTVKGMIESYERPLRGLSVYLPTRVNQRIFNEYVKRQVRSDIHGVSPTETLSISQFEEKPAPKPRFDDLRPTRDLLNLTEEIRPAFSDDLISPVNP